MRRRAAIAGLVVLFALCVPAARARAQERLPLALDWQAPAECPNADAVRSELERIARVQPGYALTPLAASARVERRGAQYATTLHTEHAGLTGERTLEAGDCATLVRSVTLVLALAFGDGVEMTGASASQSTAASTGASGTAPAENKAQNAAPPPALSSEREPATDERSDGTRNPSLRWSLLSGGGAQFGLWSSAAFAASAGVEFVFGAISIGARATGWPRVTQRVAPQLDAHFEGAGATLQGCGRVPAAVFVLALCAEARAAALHGSSDGATHDASATAPWYALAAAAAITWPRDAVVAVRVQAALAASLDRPRFVVENVAQAQRVPALAPDLMALLVITP